MSEILFLVIWVGSGLLVGYLMLSADKRMSQARRETHFGMFWIKDKGLFSSLVFLMMVGPFSIPFGILAAVDYLFFKSFPSGVID